MFPLLIESFLTQGSNGIGMAVAVGHRFLAENPESIVLLTSSSEKLWSRSFVQERNKKYLIEELLKKIKSFILYNICRILSPGMLKFKVLRLEKYFSKFQGIFPNWR